MKDWEEHLTVLTERCIATDRFDILGLYLKLSNTAANWIADKTYDIKDGASFFVNRENGTKLEFIFYSDTTELWQRMDGDSQDYIIISKDDSAKKEYSKIYNLEAEMYKMKQGLGVKVPDEFYELCCDLKPGDTISFEHKNTYMCKKNRYGELTLLKAFTGDNKNITSRTFLNAETITANYRTEKGQQDFFSKNRVTSSGAIVTKITAESKAQEFINKLYSQTPIGTTKRLQWGPISVLAKRSRNIKKKGLVWYLDGKKTDESVIKMMLGFFMNAPTTTEFVHKEPTIKTEFNDLQMLENIKTLCAKTNYEKIYTDLVDYVDIHKSDLMVNIHTFAPDNNGNFLAKSFAFKNIDGKTSVYELSYEDNDFNKDVVQIREVSAKEFVEFCNAVNKNNETYFIDAAKNEIKKELPDSQLTENQNLEVMQRAESYNTQIPIISQRDIKKYIPLEDLIEMHRTTNKEDSKDVITTVKNFFDVDR